MQSSRVVQGAMEVETAEAAGSSMLIFNYCGLKKLPAAVLESRYCQDSLKKLCLKRNFLCSLVSDDQSMALDLRVTSPSHLLPAAPIHWPAADSH